jgi:hypothetical protein
VDEYEGKTQKPQPSSGAFLQAARSGAAIFNQSSMKGHTSGREIAVMQMATENTRTVTLLPLFANCCQRRYFIVAHGAPKSSKAKEGESFRPSIY